MCKDNKGRVINTNSYKKISHLQGCSKTYEDAPSMSTLSRIIGKKILKGHVRFTREHPFQKYILKKNT